VVRDRVQSPDDRRRRALPPKTSHPPSPPTYTQPPLGIGNRGDGQRLFASFIRRRSATPAFGATRRQPAAAACPHCLDLLAFAGARRLQQRGAATATTAGTTPGSSAVTGVAGARRRSRYPVGVERAVGSARPLHSSTILLLTTVALARPSGSTQPRSCPISVSRPLYQENATARHRAHHLVEVEVSCAPTCVERGTLRRSVDLRESTVRSRARRQAELRPILAPGHFGIGLVVRVRRPRPSDQPPPQERCRRSAISRSYAPCGATNCVIRRLSRRQRFVLRTGLQVLAELSDRTYASPVRDARQATACEHTVDIGPPFRARDVCGCHVIPERSGSAWKPSTTRPAIL